jgi:hypothetical protein
LPKPSSSPGVGEGLHRPHAPVEELRAHDDVGELQRVSVAKIVVVSRPISVILSGWFESPSPNMACPATTVWLTFAPPPGTMKLGTVTPSSSKDFFSFSTRCGP